MEYKDPIFRIINAANNDVITTSGEESQQQPGNQTVTPGHYDMPIIPMP